MQIVRQQVDHVFELCGKTKSYNRGEESFCLILCFKAIKATKKTNKILGMHDQRREKDTIIRLYESIVHHIWNMTFEYNPISEERDIKAIEEFNAEQQRSRGVKRLNCKEMLRHWITHFRKGRVRGHLIETENTNNKSFVT